MLSNYSCSRSSVTPVEVNTWVDEMVEHVFMTTHTSRTVGMFAHRVVLHILTATIAYFVTLARRANTRRTTSLLPHTTEKHGHDQPTSNDGKCEEYENMVENTCANTSLPVHDLRHGTCVELSVVWHTLKSLGTWRFNYHSRGTYAHGKTL